MKISEWIKSRIESDTHHKLTYGRHKLKKTNKYNHRRGCKRYITPNRKGHTVRTRNKCPICLQRPKVICTPFTSLFPDKRSNIRRKPQKFAVDYNSFIIGIDNHTYTTTSNR